ncbi:glycosyltransferase family 2 protein [Seonamhaeicola marinus]|uniref:Glycosyltransferase family 2 protein n=1 Tax=Seonamhaeicola marinus TaxID=1912246 RepID=A0A5D0HJC8_9FLAO|nr:glycosyltransferase family 2 protein [Seonamhaeicola marinus]TYA71411.1 glycosyltransferase family 2 protein [Seonamhaeicola marinus]
MKVVAVIVTYNGIKWLNGCLQCITEQCDVVIVDNNSKDETLSFVKENYPMVKLFAQKNNLGFGQANNVGINYALEIGADAVFLLNQDVYTQVDCIKKMVLAYKNNLNFGIISPIHFNGRGDALDYSFQKVTHMSPLISDLVTKKFSKNIYDVRFINAAAWFIPKKVFSIVGGFDPLFFMYGEDDNYCQRVQYHGFKIGIIPSALIYHDSENNNYAEGKPGSEKYYQQFLNKIYVKYANVNSEDYKKLRYFKFYLLRKAILSLLIFKISRYRLFINKFKRLKTKEVINSVVSNRISDSNYLSFKKK